ncbi:MULTISPECIES: hypothetical protein [unclassified Mesorhizobium]|uniref:DUF6998 domain-containing protein n=1 Tax=unclassified Mesorhizobium TaxID=325217 RepID=UPI000FCADDAD|nr:MULTISPECIES: hypothetical protein [unclassified Mesorhizobium]RUZ85610.1 hypothetical protein EN947_12580 [Mesorhizobium sp. M7A.F.Ca.US.003.02.2.1]RUY94515.1 hypothetical protein EN974_23655 [Mesorhizobium sp. M7A.F.Ca.CA.001.12.2.1]RUZ17875.1 hypothetical protein EN949_28510 [Mesorhizobium sp. M7A.F.Ca.US.007.01.2.1]RUZ45112.1 hypothetical protein EN948_20610 [Mesorhizobium sp. M7A.F.Ca.US.003.02.1.1]RUZ65383.1 hypothetical protein EN950_12945 [Mesorhizobium sp. M7A.F.Ca.US.007.01.1.1]
MTLQTDGSTPTLTQVQIIQSLAEALSWFEKELGWGVVPAELNHLTGRIGELYAAMITRGQMALETNQRGYDVVSALNERISVKTITTSSHVSFNSATFEFVDRVMVLRVNVDEEKGISVEELLDEPAEVAKTKMRSSGSDFIYPITRSSQREQRPVEELRVTARANYSGLEIVRYESAAIRILRDGSVQPVVVKDVLRPIAAEIGVDVLNAKGEVKNTQTLGADVIRALNSRMP